MVAILSVLLLIASGVSATVADHRPAFERAGGLLIIGG